MATRTIRPPGAKATFLATLYGKAVDANAPHAILGDHRAADAAARLDVDFAALKLPNGHEITVLLRAWHVDQR